MIQSYKVIFFDAGGTLLHPYPSVGEVYHKVGKSHGFLAAPEQLQKQFAHVWKRHDGLSQLTNHVDEKIERHFWQGIVEEVFSPFGPPENLSGLFEELYDVFARPEAWHLYPETLEVLETLKKQGKRLAIISNWDSRLFKLCDSLGLTEYFDFILASAVFGASKPAPKIFLEGLKRMKIDPHESIHIGDSFEDDIKGAARVGIHTAFLDRHGSYVSHPKQNIQPHFVVQNLKQLLP